MTSFAVVNLEMHDNPTLLARREAWPAGVSIRLVKHAKRANSPVYIMGGREWTAPTSDLLAGDWRLTRLEAVK